LALYDTLNDDDDEIRDAGAKIVSKMMGICLVPMAAAEKLLPWCFQLLGDEKIFCLAVLSRLTGSEGTLFDSQPAMEQLQLAIKSDDALFVEEEQNLYVDQVREMFNWNAQVVVAKGPLWEQILDQLAAWAADGLTEILSLVEFHAFGWTSKPKVFSICMRIILGAKLVLSRNDGIVAIETHGPAAVVQHTRLLTVKMERLLALGENRKIHPVLLWELGKK
jgi:hypothetical protein